MPGAPLRPPEVLPPFESTESPPGNAVPGGPQKGLLALGKTFCYNFTFRAGSFLRVTVRETGMPGRFFRYAELEGVLKNTLFCRLFKNAQMQGAQKPKSETYREIR